MATGSRRTQTAAKQGTFSNLYSGSRPEEPSKPAVNMGRTSGTQGEKHED